MIPHNITREHILQAILHIDKYGVPDNRKSKKFALLFEGKQYPPKYVVALANIFANGKFLSSGQFNGGSETNDFLRNRGFIIVDNSIENLPKPLHVNKMVIALPNMRHDERCPECKVIIESMLNKIYGGVEANYSFDTGVYPEEYISSPYYSDLQNIYQSLQNNRNHQNFIRTSNLPRVDYYVPNPGFIVEFDESQHFTECRKLTLVQYPQNLKIGFNRNRWIDLCKNIKATDNDPPYRDEQRAWYDTLRDFLPSVKHLSPTVRLFSKSFRWCSLNPDSQSDLNRFKALLEDAQSPWYIDIHQDPNPFLARITIAGDWAGNLDNSKKLLHTICDSWPRGKRVHFLVTCGAFLSFDWPKSIPNISDNKFPEPHIVEVLVSIAENICKQLVDEELREKLIPCTNYITIGVDSYKDKVSITNAQIRKPHVEMVALLNLHTGDYHWTGKSYPTSGQEKGLIRFQDLSSHFVSFPGGKVMLLGCHDLNIFSLRGAEVTKKEWRKQVREDFYSLSKIEKPDIVLHHPHTTDSSKIWTAAWNELTEALPSVKRYLGSGRYYYDGEKQRSNIADVLQKTKTGDTLDFVIWKE